MFSKSVLFAVYVGILFFILTPSILLRLPPKGSKYTVAAVHALVFAVLFYFTASYTMRLFSKMEGMTGGTKKPTATTKKAEGMTTGTQKRAVV
jgi:phosphotransferase system  glucose/maltose/N-acetylglucosamine-specific IIC component